MSVVCAGPDQGIDPRRLSGRTGGKFVARAGPGPHRSRPVVLGLALLLASCGGEANHLGNPLAWPGQLVGSAVQNGLYDARRDRVEAFVAAHQAAILAEAAAGGGATLHQAMDLAGVPAGQRAALTAELRQGHDRYVRDGETLVVALMVHGV
jgi:hypothetical protein